jgi:predicted AlkP superfamily phosphohydrolase/phosphomutase
MGGPARTVYLGLDACDLETAQRFAREGTMPNLARLLGEAAVIETIGPIGYFVASIWPTLYTATTPARHQFLCSGQIRGGTYEPRWVGPVTQPAPVWEQVSAAGGRVAALDPPHAGAGNPVDGVVLVEYGCHDRHDRPASYPDAFLDDVLEEFGPHPVGCLMREHPHFAPCDWPHRAARFRTVEEDLALFADLAEGHRRKAAMSLAVLDRGDWDLFFSVLGESHCIGHQYWRLHDPSHVWHDPAHASAVGFDPVREMYGMLDATVGRHLERAGPDSTVYVHLSHGMAPHYDGTWLLDPVLWRLDELCDGRVARGPLTRLGDLAYGPAGRRGQPALGRAAAAARRRLAARVPMGFFDEEIPRISARRWWPQPNDTGAGAIRLNLEGREPVGRIARSRARDVACWLADRLRELVNVDTGAPAVSEVRLLDDHYERNPTDAFGDVIVEWNRDAPIDTVWSPAVGIVRKPYDQWRSGDHHRRGLLLAHGPGIVPGRRHGGLPVIDVAPTVAASLGVTMREVDGIARGDLLPTGRRTAPIAAPGSRSLRAFGEEVAAPRARHRRWHRTYDVDLGVRTERQFAGLEGAHNHTFVLAQRAADELHAMREQIAALSGRTSELEAVASITAVSSWLAQVDVPESLLVSVVMPTRNRADCVGAAIESVLRQRYSRWELLIVDDGSDDATPSVVEQWTTRDERIRAFRQSPHGGSSRARNLGLDHAKGDVVCYLDDDNRFDPGWLRAVVWAFTEHPGTQALYGARVIDDDARHRATGLRSLPVVQLLPWDDAGMLQANRVDQNVLAHRPTIVRYDERLERFNDWDFVLQLADEQALMALPVVAVYYWSDRDDRITAAPFDDAEVAAYEYVREKTSRRRATS